MARTSAKIAAFAAALMLCAPGFASACPCHAVHGRGSMIWQAPTLIGRDYGARTSNAIGLPDPMVQYGYIKNPERTSGSLGAMLQGKNPAAGVLPRSTSTTPAGSIVAAIWPRPSFPLVAPPFY
jgi:hypothetical protein